VPAVAFKIRNNLDELREIAAATTGFLESNRASPEVIFAANLAIEEMVSNTIKYAYSDGRQHEIDIQLSMNECALEIEIRDDGAAFNPFTYPAPRPAASDQRKAGGLGIHLVRNIVENFNYVRREGQNIVKLTKRL
jgi:serine/threonine-protein kinase RsbW